MSKFLSLLRHDASAQDLAEYAVALGAISIAVVLAVTAIASDVHSIWTQAQAALAG